MNNWSNIEVSPQDPEIDDINNFEKILGKLSEDIQKIRELIRRFEVCHFKCRQHLKYIKNSIKDLDPKTQPISIGLNHISKGTDAIKQDKTGRSASGQAYICSLMIWLGDESRYESEYFNSQLNKKIINWLGHKNPDKEKLVRLLVARLTWDWDSYETLHHQENFKELAFQACRMDICHYAFPAHLDALLQGIGIMQAVDDFKGCGTFTPEIRDFVASEFSVLCVYIKTNANRDNLNPEANTRLWLTACLAKTLKEQVQLDEHLPRLTGP